MNPIEILCPCKVNFVLNILGKRPDGFHDLETLFFPVPIHDRLSLLPSPRSPGIHLTCSNPHLPVDPTNLVYRAAHAFYQTFPEPPQIQIHLEKNLPLAAGLGGGSSNAAKTLLALNQFHQNPLPLNTLHAIAATLGSDVNFFLQSQPALAFGRGEQIQPVPPFSSLNSCWILLYHPGFGVPTPWAFRELARFPQARDGTPGRAARLAQLLAHGSLPDAANEFYNALETPVFEKYPILLHYQHFLRNQGAAVALMSGSGSTTFALFQEESTARAALQRFEEEFGAAGWSALAPLASA